MCTIDLFVYIYFRLGVYCVVRYCWDVTFSSSIFWLESVSLIPDGADGPLVTSCEMIVHDDVIRCWVTLIVISWVCLISVCSISFDQAWVCVNVNAVMCQESVSSMILVIETFLKIMFSSVTDSDVPGVRQTMPHLFC
jgi:hypothetical protein